MKRLIVLLLACAVTASAQFTRIEYNKTVPIFSRASTTASTANDTTKPIDIGEASDLAVFAYGADSLKAAYWYRLRNSVTGMNTAWTEFDTVVVAATGNNPDGKIIGTVVQSALGGYDGIQFYIDYVSGTTSDAGVRTVLYLYALRRSGGNFTTPLGRIPVFNRTGLVIDEYSWSSTTANDTIPQPAAADGTPVWTPIIGGTDAYYFARTNDSLRATVYYQMVNSTARDTTAWTLLDSIVTVDDLGSAAYDSTVRLAHNAPLALATILGYDGIRFYVDYDATTAGTATNADGTTNRWRLYQYLFRRD